MSIIAITSNHLRHINFLKRLKEKVNVLYVLVVTKVEGPQSFMKAERKFFSDYSGWLDRIHPVFISPEQLHSRRIIEMVKSFQPEICFVFGAPLLKEEIYNIPSKGCVNIHTGLVQHHRGVDSPYWALYENRPETIGATLHYIDSSIDGGEIIAQKNTQDLNINDSPEEIFMKTCITGFNLLEENVYNVVSGQAPRVPLNKKGRLYQSKDMNSDIMGEIKSRTPELLKGFLNGNNS